MDDQNPRIGEALPSVVPCTCAGSDASIRGRFSRRVARGAEEGCAPRRWGRADLCITSVDPLGWTTGNSRGCERVRVSLVRLTHDTGLRLAAAGLLIGVSGIIIDAGRDLGPTWTLITVSESWMAASRLIGYLLKALGLSIVFVGALLKDDG
jgi:hypothetical protein